MIRASALVVCDVTWAMNSALSACSTQVCDRCGDALSNNGRRLGGRERGGDFTRKETDWNDLISHALMLFREVLIIYV